MKKRFWLLPAALCGVAFAALEAKASRGTCKTTPDALLILGCRVRGETAEPTLRMRAEAAAAFLREHPTVIAVPCGGIVHDDQQKSEAQAIKEILLENGIDDGEAPSTPSAFAHQREQQLVVACVNPLRIDQNRLHREI